MPYFNLKKKKETASFQSDKNKKAFKPPVFQNRRFAGFSGFFRFCPA
jgi:hypothetical protein